MNAGSFKTTNVLKLLGLSFLVIAIGVFFYFLLMVFRSFATVLSIGISAIIGFLLLKYEPAVLVGRKMLKPALQVVIITILHFALLFIVPGLIEIPFLAQYTSGPHKDAGIEAIISSIIVGALSQQIVVWIYLIRYSKRVRISLLQFISLAAFSVILPFILIGVVVLIIAISNNPSWFNMD